MSAETVVAAKILCEARSRQKLRELGQNFSQENLSRNENSPTTITARHQFFSHQILQPCAPRQLNLAEHTTALATFTPLASISSSSTFNSDVSRNPTSTGDRPQTKEIGSLCANFSDSSNAKDWSFSSVTGKLYAARNKRINVQLSDTERQIQIITDKENSQAGSEYFVRFLLVYGSDQHVTRPVVRCQPHLDAGRRLSGSPNQVIDLSPASRFPANGDEDHVVRCHNVGAKHIRDRISGRLSVVLPVNIVPKRCSVKSEIHEDVNQTNLGLANPAEAAGSADVDLSFGCLNTCLGAEYSLRNWNIIITLEKSDFSVLGRRVIPVKVCAAPKRERSVEEKNTVEGKSKRSRSSNTFSNSNLLSASFDEIREDEIRRRSESPASSVPMTPTEISPSGVASKKLVVKSDEHSNLFLAVDSLEELRLLTNIRNELRSSPTLKALLLSKLEN